MFFSVTVFRVLTPYREVTWADFLLADVLTSLSKPLADMERAACHLLTGPTMDPSERVSRHAFPAASWRQGHVSTTGDTMYAVAGQRIATCTCPVLWLGVPAHLCHHG